jgi:hypothetical protein
MKPTIRLFILLAAPPLAALALTMCRPALAEPACRIGDVCVLQNRLFGCRDPNLIKRWIDLSVERDREAAETFISEQAAAGQCARFGRGERLILIRYLGLRRLEARRPGESQSYILLLK